MLGQARRGSPALRSPGRALLNLMDGTPRGQVFRVAKFDRRNADPKSSDITLTFVDFAVGAGMTSDELDSSGLNRS